MIILDYDICSLQIIIPFCDGIINSISFLFSQAPFSLFLESVVRERQLEILYNCVPGIVADASV